MNDRINELFSEAVESMLQGLKENDMGKVQVAKFVIDSVADIKMRFNISGPRKTTGGVPSYE